MAWYEIKHRCGHEERVQLYGKNSERERRIGWLESQPCLQCRLEGADDLEGSDKQRAWAAEIRREVAKSAEGDDVEVVMAEKSARWWIDNRDRSADEIVAELRVYQSLDNDDAPKLSGSVKQIAWAKHIRAEMIYTIQSEAPDGNQQVVDLMIEFVVSHDESRWFIDHNRDASSLFSLARLANDYVLERKERK